MAVWIAALLALPVQVVNAHPGDGMDGHWWAWWSLDPLVLLGIGLTGLLYERGRRALMRRGAFPSGRQQNLFWTGLGSLVLAMVSPLDGLAGQLFWVHMLQHTLLMLVAAPLLVLGMRAPLLLLGLPRPAQLGAGWIWKRLPALHAASRSAALPVVIWLVQAGVLWGWHAPRLYTAAVTLDFVHALQHLSFLGAAIGFWWAALRYYGAHPERRGAGVLYLFTTALHSGMLGALITFSPVLLYPVYAGRAEAWGLAAMADQQLAGTIMWVPAGLVFLAAALFILRSWIDSIHSAEGSVPEKELE